MSIGHSPDEGQWTPDMRKSEGDITEADKQEAMRRIQGNFAMEGSAHDSGSDDDGGSKRRMARAPTMNTFAASAM